MLTHRQHRCTHSTVAHTGKRHWCPSDAPTCRHCPALPQTCTRDASIAITLRTNGRCTTEGGAWFIGTFYNRSLLRKGPVNNRCPALAWMLQRSSLKWAWPETAQATATATVHGSADIRRTRTRKIYYAKGPRVVAASPLQWVCESQHST